MPICKTEATTAPPLATLVGKAADVGASHLADAMIREAIAQNASDIHIEPGPEGGVVRYRVDGILRDAAALPRDLLSPLISRVKVMAELEIHERRAPRTGTIRVRVGTEEGEVDHHLRVATMPTLHGECLVLRILPPPSLMEAWTPERVGLPEEVTKALQSRPGGLFLFAGPAGSGKTTVMCAALRPLNSVTRKCVLIDGGDLRIPWIASSKPGVPVEAAIRALAERDVDVVAVGEVHTCAEAEAALDAASTGRKVLACMHSEDAVAALDRLAALGVPATEIAGGLAAVVASRLVRRVCAECQQPHVPAPGQLEALYITPEEAGAATLLKGAGCESCRGTGYRGRIAILEIVLVDGLFAGLLAEGVTGPALRARLVGQGFRDFRHDAGRKVLAGITSVDEALRVTGYQEAHR